MERSLNGSYLHLSASPRSNTYTTATLPRLTVPIAQTKSSAPNCRHFLSKISISILFSSHLLEVHTDKMKDTLSQRLKRKQWMNSIKICGLSRLNSALNFRSSLGLWTASMIYATVSQILSGIAAGLWNKLHKLLMKTKKQSLTHSPIKLKRYPAIHQRKI